jgi:hypothetical protein
MSARDGFFAAACALALAASAVRAQEELPVCFNYGCQTLAMVRLEPAQLKRVGGLFARIDSPEAERAAIADAMAWLYSYAGEQTPTWLDRGGNLDDDGIEGRMDCLDHSTNTTTWLALLARQGWVRYHAVAGPVQRGRLLSVHWSARVLEKGTGAQFVVDTWFLDPGYPAIIYPLDEWMDGARPPGTEIFRWQQSSAR